MNKQTCPHCGHSLNAREERPAKTAKCPNCGRTVGREDLSLGTGVIILAASLAVAGVIIVWVYWGEYLQPKQPRAESGGIYAMMAAAVAEANLDGLAVMLSMSHDEVVVLSLDRMEYFRPHAERTRRNFPGTDDEALHEAVLRVHGARRYWRGLTVLDAVQLLNASAERRAGTSEATMDASATARSLHMCLEYAYFRPHLGGDAPGELAGVIADIDWIEAWLRDGAFDPAPGPGPSEIQAFRERITDGAAAP